MTITDHEMRIVFFDELRKLLTDINTNLVLLEKEPNSVTSLNEILRFVHTLKGLFAGMEFDNAAKLCHILEDALIHVIKANFINSDTLDILFTFLNKIEELNSFLLEKSPEENLYEGVDAEFNFSSLIQELESLTLGTLNLGAKYRIIVLIDPNATLRGARAYQVLRSLEDIAKVIESTPTKEEIEEGVVFSNLEIQIFSQENDTAIRRHLAHIDDLNKIDIEFLMETKELVKKGTTKSSVAIQSVRVQLSNLDEMMDLVGELVIERNALSQQLTALGVQSQLFTQMDRTILDLRQIILKTRLVPLEYLFDHFPRLIREATKESGKKVKLVIAGKYVEIDRTSIDALNESLIHLIRNSIFHGIENSSERESLGKESQGLIQITAKIDKNDVVITVEDDGHGIDVIAIREKAEKEGLINIGQKVDREGLLALLFLSGFSTSERVTKLGGRGIGLTIVNENIRDKLNGTIDVATKKGKGTRFTIRIPTLISIIDGLIVKVSDREFSIPLPNIQHVYNITKDKLYNHNGRPIVVINKEIIPVITLVEAFGLNENEEGKSDDFILILWEQGGKKIGIVVDEIVSQQQIVLKKSDRLMGSVKGFSGFTLIGEGIIVPVLDPSELLGV